MVNLGRLYRGEKVEPPFQGASRTALRPKGLQEYAERTGNPVVQVALAEASKVFTNH